MVLSLGFCCPARFEEKRAAVKVFAVQGAAENMACSSACLLGAYCSTSPPMSCRHAGTSKQLGCCLSKRKAASAVAVHV